MKIIIIGGTGYIGSALTREALTRGHEVTVLTRTSAASPKGSEAKHLILGSTEGPLSAHLMAAEVVISATRFTTANLDRLLQSVRDAAVPRLIIVGGAGSLISPAGGRVVDRPDFPSEWKEEALAGAKWLETLRTVSDVDWTFVSPSADLFPGPKTGRFRLGGDQLLMDARGVSSISTGDFAAALLDEAELRRHSRQRFTVGY